MAKRRSHILTDALRKRQLVRFTRRFEASPVRGYVLDVGPEFFVLGLVSDRLWLDGFECFRAADVTDVRPDPHAGFAEAALSKRGERIPPEKPLVDVTSINALLLSAGRAFPLVTIHREEVRPEACWIGRVLGVERGRLSLLEITPGAAWDRARTQYRVDEITRVNFGGDYEGALYLVGGEPGARSAGRR